jgi:hypothetical protein
MSERGEKLDMPIKGVDVYKTQEHVFVNEVTEEDVKQFLFDSCPDSIKKYVSEYIDGLKSAKELGRDGIDIKMEVVIGRWSNPKLPYKASSHFLKHLLEV